MVTRFAGHNQIGQRFEITPQIKKDGVVEDLNLDGHTSLSILIKQPDGTILERNAGVKGELLTEILVGQRVDDPSLTVDKSNLNDGNDGSIASGGDQTVNIDLINWIGSYPATGEVELPPNSTTTFYQDRDSRFVTGQVLIGFREDAEGPIEVTQYEYFTFNSSIYGDASTAIRTSVSAGTNYFTHPQHDRFHLDRITIENKGPDTLKLFHISGTISSSQYWTEALISTPAVIRPFTSLFIKKNETLILKDLVTRHISIEQNLYFYVRGAAFPFIQVDYYLNSTYQTSEILSGLDEPLVSTGDKTFDELHITVLETTNGGGIELGGISEYFQSTQQAYSIQSWDEAFLTSVAEYPFDENLNTEIQLAAGEWYFESVGDKEVKRLAVTRPIGTTDNPNVEISTFIDGFKVIIGDVTPQITNGIPTYINITDEPRPFETLTLSSTESFQLHELEVEGQTESFANDSTIFYTDPQGLLTQKGLYEYKVKVVYDNGNTIISYNSGAFFVK